MTMPYEAEVTSSNLSAHLLCGHVKKKKLSAWYELELMFDVYVFVQEFKILVMN
jgi:hypothetical protein